MKLVNNSNMIYIKKITANYSSANHISGSGKCTNVNINAHWSEKNRKRNVCMMKEFVQRGPGSLDTERNRFVIVNLQRGIVLCTAGMENTWLIHSTSMSASTTTIQLTSSLH